MVWLWSSSLRNNPKSFCTNVPKDVGENSKCKLQKSMSKFVKRFSSKKEDSLKSTWWMMKQKSCPQKASGTIQNLNLKKCPNGKSKVNFSEEALKVFKKGQTALLQFRFKKKMTERSVLDVDESLMRLQPPITFQTASEEISKRNDFNFFISQPTIFIFLKSISEILMRKICFAS